jgi:hypothetical protein
MKQSMIRSIHRAAVVAALSAAACADAPRGLLTGAPNPPPEVEHACSVTAAKCARCHPIDRVVVARGIGMGKWQMYVEQMRLKPSSGISVKDTEVIFQCLRFVEDKCTECRQGHS